VIVLSTKSIKSGRKRYYCEDCQTHIEIGEPSEVINQVFEGEFYSLRYHPECDLASRDIADLLEGDEGRYFLIDGLGNWGGSVELKDALETLRDNHPIVFARIKGEERLTKILAVLPKASPRSASPQTLSGHGDES